MDLIRNVAFCPHCGNLAPQKLSFIQKCLSDSYSTDGDLIGKRDTPEAYYISTCETCGGVLLYYDFGDCFGENDFHHADLVWPNSDLPLKGIPKTVSSCYSEAVRIKRIAPNAFAVQIRRSLEALCDDRGAKEGPLQKRLLELVSKGEMPSILAEMTDVLRLLGNIGAHATDQAIKPGHVYMIDEFFRTIVEYVYVAPKKLKKYREALGLNSD